MWGGGGGGAMSGLMVDWLHVNSDNNNNVHLSCAHQRPERSCDTY